MKRVILHCDLNCFFASVEMLYHPELKKVPMAIAGDPENRHGIILAKNVLAKKAGVKTGESILEAKKKCPKLVIRDTDYEAYSHFSKLVKDIYYEYTDRVESFGIDEAWLDITGSIKYFGSVKTIVEEILRRVKEEIGLTLSIGVSFNKIYAKLGSDIASEDAFYVIKNGEDIFDLPADALLNVGKSTYEHLKKYNIYTIGDIAHKTPEYLKNILGKWGETLYYFANGYDLSEVKKYHEDKEEIKSIGNSITTFRDLYDLDDIKLIVRVLADSVSSRVKDLGMYFKTVHLSLRDKNLLSSSCQMTLKENTDLGSDIFNNTVKLFEENYDFKTAYRSVGVSVSHLSFKKDISEISLFDDHSYSLKDKKSELAIEDIRRRFGYHAIGSLRLLEDSELSNFDPKSEHTFFPISYFGR